MLLCAYVINVFFDSNNSYFPFVKLKFNRIAAVQEYDAPMLKKEQMQGS